MRPFITWYWRQTQTLRFGWEAFWFYGPLLERLAGFQLVVRLHLLIGSIEFGVRPRVKANVR